jgi:DNA-binding transcriptional LysR family regulator
VELRQLEHFVAVAGELSFTRAAGRVHVVQSALSTSVAKLERELGVELFDRTRQRITLTPAGEDFLAHAREVLLTARSAAESVAAYRGHLSGNIDFGSLISYGPMDVPRALGDFHRAHPHVRLRLRLSQAGAWPYLAAVVDGSLDLALVSAPNRPPPQLDMRLLFEEPMVFVCRADHPQARRKRLDLGDVAGEDLVGFPPEFGLRRLMDSAFDAAGVAARTQYELPAGFGAIADLVSHGLGTAFMPASEARRFRGLRSVDLAHRVMWRVYLAVPPPQRISPAAAALAEMLADVAGRIRPADEKVKRR